MARKDICAKGHLVASAGPAFGRPRGRCIDNGGACGSSRRARVPWDNYPEMSPHRGRLHMILYRTALASLGANAVRTDQECVGVEQHDAGATKQAREGSGRRT